MAKQRKLKQNKKSKITSHWTRLAASKVEARPNNTFPPFDISKVTPFLSNYHLWDSWFILDESGKVALVHGFKVLVGLVRPVSGGSGDGEKIAYFYTKDGTHYSFGGMLFSTPVYEGVREWSGSTILRDNGSIQTFYTIAEGVTFDGVWQTSQRFATAIQEPSTQGDRLVIGNPSYHEFFKEPDGVIYETAEQAARREQNLPTQHKTTVGSDQTENFCFRDPKFFKDPETGKAYIFFEGNTGPKSGYAAGTIKSSYFGSKDLEEGYEPTTDDLKANGCVGVIELTDSNYTFGEFQEPLLTSNLVTDEIERINVVEHLGKYYLFVAAHGNKCTVVAHNEDLVNRDFMLGFVSDSLFGEYKPLNGSGVVVQQKSLGAMYSGQEENHQYVYSWLVVPVDGGFEVISYANYSTDSRGDVKAIKSCGPTVGLELNGSRSRITSLKYNLLAA